MNKIIIDGKEYELSDDLVVQIKAEVAAQEKAENLFERNVDGRYYFFISGTAPTAKRSGKIGRSSARSAGSE